MRGRLAVVGLLVLAACSGNEYPESFRASFKSNCLRTSGGQLAYCDCALDWLEEHVDYEDAKEGEGVSDAVLACQDEAL